MATKIPPLNQSSKKSMPENDANVMASKRKAAMDKIVARRRRAMKKEMC